MKDKASPYVITAQGLLGEPKQTTRISPASAVVLARRWAELGYEQVQVTDSQGRRVDPASYGRPTLRYIS